MEIAELAERGDQALAEGRWDEARQAFEAVLAEEETPAALLGLAQARWWSADAIGSVELFERAYARLRDAGEPAAAADTAIWLAIIQRKSLGNETASNGWIERAATLLGEGRTVLHGWLDIARAHAADEPDRIVAAGRRALDIARAADDTDLELCALGEVGRGLVATGAVDEGLRLVDEAMAAAVGGEFTSLDAVVAATCSMVSACDLAADLDRVTEWCRAADRFMRTYGCPFLFADCRTRYGSVLVATGHWEDGERELSAALRTAPPETHYHQVARARLADLRLRQGRLEEADALLDGAGDEPAAWPAAAAVRHAHGEHEVAIAIAERLIGAVPSGQDGAAALALLVDAHLARGESDAARSAAARLERMVTDGDDRSRGHAEMAAGRVALDGGESAAARTAFERAIDHFARANLPYESARGRVALAEASLEARPEVAAAEAQEAFATFERLGARRDADAVAALLRTLGAPARTGPKGLDVLTERERDVLRLLAQGLTNPEIGERLYISRKTASHHVSNVLSKLGLRNRAEAAAYATRWLASHPPSG